MLLLDLFIFIRRDFNVKNLEIRSEYVLDDINLYVMADCNYERHSFVK